MTHAVRIQKIKACLMMCYIILYILDSFFHRKLWTTLLGAIIVFLLCISYPKAKNFNKYLSTILVISGAYLLIKRSAPVVLWEDALLKNAGITVLLLSVPLLSIVFNLVDFSSYISNFARKYVNSNYSFYVLTFLTINFFAAFLNVASYSMVHKLLEDISEKYPKKMYYAALTRGFALVELWAPNFISMAVVLQYSGLQWHSYVLFGFGLFLIGTALCLIMARISANKYKGEVLRNTQTVRDETAKGGFKGLLKAVSTAAVLIISIISIQYLWNKSIMVVVPFAALVFPLILALLSRKINTYIQSFKEYFNDKLPKMNNEVVLFTSIGFFAQSLSSSGADKYIPLIIQRAGISSPIILIPFIIIVITLLSTVGFHPILTISAISIAYSGGAIPLSPVQMAAAFSLGYINYALLSPFSGNVLAVASLERKGPFEVGMNLNLGFCMLFICICSVVIAMM